MPEYYGDSKKHFEAAIPIIIIILLVVGLVLWKPELFTGIPIVGDWFAPKTINVLLISDQASEKDSWSTHLSGEMGRNVFGHPLNVDAVTPTGGTYTHASINDPGWLRTRKVGLVVLTGTELSDSLQLTLKKWVEEDGGKLLVIGQGGTQQNGRWAELTRIMPVRCGIDEDCTTAAKTIHAPKLHIIDYESGLMECIDDKTPLTEANGSITITDVNTAQEGHEIVYIEGFSSADEIEAGDIGDIHAGILEKNVGMNGGKVLYMSFNPTSENISPYVEKSLVINLVAYTSGVSCYKP